jgi:hypothetical protein
MTPEVLCTACGQVDVPKAGSCAGCGSKDLLPADAPAARKFIEERKARNAVRANPGEPSVRAEATGKVLGRALGKLLGK